MLPSATGAAVSVWPPIAASPAATISAPRLSAAPSAVQSRSESSTPRRNRPSAPPTHKKKSGAPMPRPTLTRLAFLSLAIFILLLFCWATSYHHYRLVSHEGRVL